MPAGGSLKTVLHFMQVKTAGKIENLKAIFEYFLLINIKPDAIKYRLNHHQINDQYL